MFGKFLGALYYLSCSVAGSGKVIKAYFRCCAEARHAEVISAWLGFVLHASVLDKENIAVLKRLY